MMRLMTNGEPTIHTHIVGDTPAGDQLTPDELLQFSVQSLIEEYRRSTTELSIFPKKHPSDPDFTIKSAGSEIHVLVVYQRDLSVNIEEMDISRMLEIYHETGSIPRLIIASSWCFADNCNGMQAIAGADFCFKFHPICLLPNQRNTQFAYPLDHNSLVKIYANMWKALDADIIKPYLHRHFHYSSTYVFDEIPSRHEYLNYIRGKFDAIRNSNTPLKITIARDKELNFMGVVIKQGEKQSIFLIKTKDGYITRVDLKIYED